MIEHPTKQELDEYRRRVLTPGGFLSVHRHVNACPHCAAQCNSSEELARDLEVLNDGLLYAPDETPFHLSTADVMAYVRGTADQIDLEIAESHLSVCETCVTEVQRYKDETAAPARVESTTFGPRWWMINRWQPWRVAAVVCAGVALILFAFWLLRSKPNPRSEEIAGPVNQSSPQSSPTVEATPAGSPGVVAEAQFALVLNDGNQKVTLDEQGGLAGLERLPSAVQLRVQAALQTGKLQQSSALAHLNNQPSKLLGNPGNGLPFRLIGPLGHVVRSEQPTFRWRELAGAQSYVVSVTDADLNEVATSPPLNTIEWRISKPLKEGGVYSWQVTALKDGVRITSPVLPAPQAKFKVLDRATSEILKQAQNTYPDSHLTLGVLYAEAGLLDEAEQELRTLIRNNPRARIALKLLQNVRAMRAAQTTR
ncbi:MAG TPA: hypothetical protein VJP89_04930 [Pyrinomonadaceae bacterium]|nr:hypothetical protein [Pyrinomonadaceae bacterium]